VGVGFHEPVHEQIRMDTHDDQESTLSASDLASILKWSKDISSDINLASGEWVALIVITDSLPKVFSALQRLTEIATGNLR
jgi:hypothetical protein